MTSFVLRGLSGAIAALTLATTPAVAATSATTSATVNVSLLKALVLSGKQNMNFGTVIVANSTVASSISMTPAGVISCTATVLTCAGTGTAGIYNVQGQNNQVVNISATTTLLKSSLDATGITFTPTVQASVTLTSSGAPGNDFPIGGSIAIPAGAAGGVYTGNINVTVDYN